jgi:predicted dehydrogenase
MRVGIVGTGGIARAHGRACREVEGAELVAICDVSREALDRFGEEFGVARRYVELDAMLATEELDVAILCNWGVHHAETGIRIAESRRVRAILCEKPFTSTGAEAERLVAAARENDVRIAEAFKFRHHPMHLKAKELIDAGAIGDVAAVRSTFCVSMPAEARQPERNWRWDRARGGGSIYDLGCYCIHHARFVFDVEPCRVFASGRAGVEVDDAASVTLVFSGGRTAQISVGFNSWHSQYAEISGSEGMLRMEQAWNNEDQPVTLEHVSQKGVQTIPFAPVFAFADQLRHLQECLATGQSHRIPPENSIGQMQVIDAVFASMATGNAVDVAG